MKTEAGTRWPGTGSEGQLPPCTTLTLVRAPLVRTSEMGEVKCATESIAPVSTRFSRRDGFLPGP